MGGRRRRRSSSRARRRRLLAALGGLGAALFLAAARAAPPDDAPQPVPTLDTIAVTARRLDAARAEIEPRIGASTYAIPEAAIERQPGGDNNPLSQVVLQAPGVSQEAFGQLHIRNEMANLQFRINGIILPEGVSFFGQSLSPRFAGAVELITGAYDSGGYVGMYGGSHGSLQPSAVAGGSIGGVNYFASGDYLQNGIGIENPTPSYHPIHDETQQGHGFAYIEDIVDATSKASLIFGTFRGQFEIPNIPGRTPNFAVAGGSGVNSADLNENQREISHYAVASYLKTSADLDVQVSAFSRYSSVAFEPDPVGDLVFNGIAQNAYRRSIATGLQAESSYRLAADHTVRSGAIVTGERSTSETTSLVLPVTSCGGGVAVGNGLCSVADIGAKTGWTYSLYLQDEWRLTPAFTLNYGGRFDVVNTLSNENQISPRVNAVWRATPSTTVHAGYASYFSPPPFELLSVTTIGKFSGTSAAPEVTENSPVKAERDHYFDVGVSQKILDGFTAGIDAYYKYARNLIDIGQFGAPIIFTPFNYHMGRNLGVELTASYTSGNVTLYGNVALAYQKAKGIASAQFHFSQEELDYLNTHTFQTDHSQIMTASGGVSYLWQGTRLSADTPR